MSISRDILLWCSSNPWMKENVPKMGFVRSAVKKFMPGENVEDAIKAAKEFKEVGIKTVFTNLGENLKNIKEAEEVADHYKTTLEKINNEGIPTEISLKLTHLGFDFSNDKTFELFKSIASKANGFKNFVWIDIEQSSYIDRTLEFYSKIKKETGNVGLCLQSYLYRTKADLQKLMNISPNIRLVKGAYKEPAEIAFPDKRDVDNNYFEISKLLLQASKEKGTRSAIGTHDLTLISKIEAYAKEQEISRDKLEFHMLYGIKPNEQLRLVKEGYRVTVLISYGSYWYPWYVRRLAERPANVGFVLKNLFTN